MEGLKGIFKKQPMSELILTVLLIVYLIIGYNTPEPIAIIIDSLAGKIGMFIIVVYMFLNSHPVLAILALFVAFDLLKRSSDITGIDALQKYSPSEDKKSSQYSAFNQFPYTLEQEIVKKMAPLIRSGTSITEPSYKPKMDDLHDAHQIFNI